MMIKRIQYFAVVCAAICILFGVPSIKADASDTSDIVSGAFVTTDEKTILLTVDDLDARRDISGVKFDIWHDGVTDLRAYYAARQSDGRWIAFMAVSDYGKSGSYAGYAELVYPDGSTEIIDSVNFSISNNTARQVTFSSINEATGDFEITVEGVRAPSGVEEVRIPVWSDANLSDIYWYTAKKRAENTYTVRGNIRNHQYHYAMYAMDVYVSSENGVTNSAVSNCQEIRMPASDISAFRATETEYILVADKLPYGELVQSVRIGLWNEGISDLRWYEAPQQSDGRWMAVMSVKDYGKSGTYGGDVYAVLKNGQNVKVGSLSFAVEKNSVSDILFLDQNQQEGTFHIMLGGVKALGGVSGVQVEVWTEDDRSDLYTYNAYGLNEETYLLQVDVANHDYHYGNYKVRVKVQGNVIASELSQIVKYSFDMPQMSLSAVTVNNEADCVMRIENVPYGKHLQNVQFVVWNQGGADMRGYQAVRQQDGNYERMFSMTDYNKMGTFYVLAQAHMDDGKTIDLGLTSFRIYTVNGNYSIMGTSGTTVSQMVNYFLDNAVYPEFYLNSDAPTIEDFCQIFYDEATAEGVRAEVVFSQAMKETGFLRFTGRVPITAYNFAGIGAVDDSDTAYAVFSDVREGVRAQIQHLKAYASIEPLVNPQVDPRFDLVTRGCAPYVEWLGQKENPSGLGWATAEGYGYSLRDDYMKVLFTK